MKKLKLVIFLMFMFIPFVNAKALKCGSENVMDPNTIKNFTCIGVVGDTLTFNHNGEDITSFFEIGSKNENSEIKVKVKNKDYIKKFSNIEVAIIEISDSNNKTAIKMKNPNYVSTTVKEQETTTTTTNTNKTTYTVILQDKEEKTEKKCEVSSGSTCSITLPTLDKDGFNGWGTQATCKEGSRGTIKVEKNTTYYACYNNVSNNNNNTLLLTDLKITDKKTNKKIDFGDFDAKVFEYEFKVLNEVESLLIDTKSIEGTTVTLENNEKLIVGENTIKIKLTDKNNNEVTYTLKVTRLKKGETLKETHYLKTLIIGGYEIDFKQDIFNYTITIDSNINELQITKVPLNPDKDTVTVEGNQDLKNGSVIKIIVTGKDGSSTTYFITIIKKNKISLTLLITVSIISFIIVILVIMIFIKSNNKNNPKTTLKKEKPKKQKKTKSKNKPEVLKDNNSNIEVLKF